MSFRLALSVADAVRELVLAELDAAIERLARPTPARIHAARKHCKKARAAVRLLDPARPRDYWKPLDAAIADGARAVATRRQAQVLQETVLGLARQEPALTTECEGLRRRLRRGRGGQDAPLRAVEALKAARAAAAALPWSVLDLPAVQAALRKSYRTARKAWRRSLKAGADEAMHDWRKRSKRHAYQCQLLAGLWPALSDRAAQLDELNDALGEHHDLADLKRWLRTSPDLPSSALLDRIGLEQRRQERAAFAFAEVLYGAPPQGWTP